MPSEAYLDLAPGFPLQLRAITSARVALEIERSLVLVWFLLGPAASRNSR